MKQITLLVMMVLTTIMLASSATALFDMEVTSINAPTNAMQGDLVTFEMNITNNGPDPFVGSGYELWTQRGDSTSESIDLTGITLAAGESTIVSEAHAYPYGATFNYQTLFSFYNTGVDPVITNDYLNHQINITALVYDLELTDISMNTYRGTQDTATMNVENVGNTAVQFLAAVSVDPVNGSSVIPSSSTTLTPQSVTLQPGESTTLTLDVDINSASTQPLKHIGNISVVYFNGYSNIEEFNSLTINVQNENPIINIPSQSAIVGLGYYLDVSLLASDAFDTITYDLLSGPAGMNLDSVSGEITWTPTNTIPVNVNVQVTDSYGAVASQTFTITPVADAPAMRLQDNNDLILGGVNQNREVITSTTIELFNTGTEFLTISLLELRDNGGAVISTPYNPSLSISSTYIAPFTSEIITIDAYVPADAAARRALIGALYVEAIGVTGNVSDSEQLYLQARSDLEIIDVDIEVEGDSEDVSPGETIDVQEGDSITLEVKLGANNDLEDAYFEVEDDEDFDLNYESNEEDIDAGDEETLRITFELPARITEDNCEVTLIAYAEDNNGLEHYAEFIFSLDLDREDDDLKITSLSWVNNDLELTIRNTGLEDQTNSRVEVLSNQNIVLANHDLTRIDEGDSEDFLVNVNFNNPLFNLQEQNTFKVLLYSDDGSLTDYQTIDLTTTIEESNPEVNTPEVTTPVVSEERQIVSYGVTKSSRTNYEDILVFGMILAAMLLFGILIWIIAKHRSKKGDDK